MIKYYFFNYSHKIHACLKTYLNKMDSLTF